MDASRIAAQVVSGIGFLGAGVIFVRKENIIGSFIDLESAAKEVGIICDNYRTVKTDLTILLTHIGLEMDKKLAEALDPDWGVNLIIGGHSHTFVDGFVHVADANGKKVPIITDGCWGLEMGQINVK